MISFGRSHVCITVHGDLPADQAVAGKCCGDAVPQADAILLPEIAEPRGHPEAMFDSLDRYPRAQGRAFKILKRTSHITVVLATPDELVAASAGSQRRSNTSKAGKK